MQDSNFYELHLGSYITLLLIFVMNQIINVFNMMNIIFLMVIVSVIIRFVYIFKK